MMFLRSILALGLFSVVAHGELTVASLNSLVGAIAREVGGDKIQLVELMGYGDNPHVFEPSPSQLMQVQGARYILVSGKGLETYLGDLRGMLGPDQEILEVGRLIPSMKVQPGSEHFACCPVHSHGGIDPHWWHSPRNAGRAARILAKTFAKADPDHATVYTTRAKAFVRQMDQLER